MGGLFLVGGSVIFVVALFLTWSAAAVVDIVAEIFLSITPIAFVLSLLSACVFVTIQLEQYHGSGRLSGST